MAQSPPGHCPAIRRGHVFLGVTAAAFLYGSFTFTVSAQDYLEGMGFGKLKEALGTGVPTGAGIQVAHVEASVSTVTLRYLPQSGTGTFAGGGNFSGKTFTEETTGDGIASGHAISVGNFFYGNRTDPSLGDASMAPGVTMISCYEASNYITGNYASATGDKVHSSAWIGNDPTSNSLLLNFDDSIESNGFLAVVGLNNGAATAVPELLASAYNVLSVGRSDGQHSSGTTPGTVDGPGRIKPELVADYTATSWATGGISSLATLLYATADSNPSWSEAFDHNQVMKAIVMAGATKQEFPSWGRTTSSPLDSTFGAGEANVFESHRILTSGDQAAGGAVSRQGWDFDSAPDDAAVREYTVTVPAGLHADELSIVLNWNRLVVDPPGPVKVAGRVPDLALELLSPGGATQWDLSDSAVDNVEHIYYRNLPPGQYLIRVTRNDSLSENAEYGIAWRTVLGGGPKMTLDLTSGTTLDMIRLDPRIGYTIQRTTDLDPWADVHTFTPSTPTAQWTDPAPPAGPRVHYRLKWTPYTN